MNKTIHKSGNRWSGTFALILLALAPVALKAQNNLPFGDSGEIRYDTEAGTATVITNSANVLTACYAVVKDGATTWDSRDYTTRIVTQKDTTDSFGTGKKMTVVLTGSGLPRMKQIFYTYSGKNYFLTEVIVQGTNLSTNYMAPLVTGNADVQQAGDNRVLFVPFDNDTFIRYRSVSMSTNTTNTSSEVTAVYDNTSRNGLVIGSVEHSVWKTGIRTTGTGKTLTALTAWGGYTEEGVTRDKIAHGALTGSSIKSPKIFVGFFADWRNGLDEYAKANAVAEPRYVFDWTQPTPFGWNSWGSIQDKLTLDKAKAVAQFFATSLSKFRNGETAFIDLDSYWDNLVSGGMEGDFSQLIAFASYCKDRGLKPGIYWAPFVDWGKSDRVVEGSTYRYPEVWTKVKGEYHDLDGARAMDPTHPATQKRIDLLIGKFKQCGFEMIKIDFIGHAAIEADSYYDPAVKTGMQAFKKGMEYLVDKLEGKMLVYAAISPSLATGPYVHSRRIACDAYSDINATEYTLNSTTYGWWQTHIYNFVDADHLVLKNETLGTNRARVTSGVINGTLISGDDFSTTGQWSDRARILFQNQDVLDIARNGVAFTPVEGNAAQSASEVFVNKIGTDYYVAVINYGEKKSYDLTLERLGISSDEYVVKELFSGTTSVLSGTSLKRDVDARDAAIFRFRSGSITATTPEAGNDTVTLYPNPTAHTVHLHSAGKNIRSFKVIDRQGKLIAEEKSVNKKDHDINVSGLPKGLYIITLTDASGKIKVFKFVKD